MLCTLYMCEDGGIVGRRYTCTLSGDQRSEPVGAQWMTYLLFSVIVMLLW